MTTGIGWASVTNYYLHIPRTAGTSLHALLPAECYVYLNHDLRDAHYRHPSAVCTAADYTFGFVRDPYDRLVSAYHFLRGGGRCKEDGFDGYLLGLRVLSLRDFVIGRLAEAATWQIHFVPQSFYLAGVPQPQLYDFTKLEPSFREIRCRIGLNPDVPIPELNRSTRVGHPADELDDEARKVVRDIYSEDFLLLEKLGFAAVE